MSELFKLVDEYMALHPEAENPLNYFNALGLDELIDALKNANGKVLDFIPAKLPNVIDGGRIA
jgi:hypothetical protein